MSDQKFEEQERGRLTYAVYIIGEGSEIGVQMAKNFSHMGNRVESTCDMKHALETIEGSALDIVLVVGTHTKKDLELVKHIRKRSDVPILVIARDSQIPKEKIADVLDSGADDYVCYPFSQAELCARVENIVKRRKDLVFKNTKVTARNLQLDIKKHVTSIHGKLLPLTKMEYLILEYLLLNKNSLIRKAQIEARVFPFAKQKVTHLLNTHILHLRKKLGTEFPIKTIPHQGFVLAD